jgi:uncharacterized protein (DUF302 family)
MKYSGRRVILHLDFETTIGVLSRALRNEGFEILARVDVRDQCRHVFRHEFRQYILIEAWPPDLAFDALRRNPDLGPLLPVTFAAYELSAGETVVVFAGQRHARADLTRLLDQEIVRIGEVFHQLELTGQHSEQPAA